MGNSSNSPQPASRFARIRHRLPRPFPAPATELERKQLPRRFFGLHFRPATVPAATLQFTLSWGLGGLAAILVLLQAGTGLLLKLVYVPTPQGAYASLEKLTDQVLFGDLIRNIHHWSANLLVLIVLLHLLRVFFTSAFHGLRRLNWFIGLLQLGLVLGANLTGYLLPWDQLAFWAVTICTGMLDYVPGCGPWLLALVTDGGEIGPSSLRLFYALHTAVLPVVLGGVMTFHFWRVRKAGGLVRPRDLAGERPDPDRRLTSWPHLFLRELTAAAVLVAVILTLALAVDAPLGDPANPGLSPNPTKAPWYFAGIQELLLHLHPTCAVVVMPLLALAGLSALPYLRYAESREGIWLVSAKGRSLGAYSAIAAVVLVTGYILCDGFLFDAASSGGGAWDGWLGQWGRFALLLSGLGGYWLLLKKKMGASRNEAVQAVFVFLFTGFVVLTLTNVWFRGPSMALTWPWAV